MPLATERLTYIAKYKCLHLSQLDFTPEMQGAPSKAFPCLLRCSLILKYPIPWKRLKVLRIINSGTKRGAESPLYVKFAAIAVTEDTNNVSCLFFSWHFVAFEILARI